MSAGLPGHASSQVPSSENSIEEFEEVVKTLGSDIDGMDAVKRLVVVDQKPVDRTPRSILATYTGCSITSEGCSRRRSKRGPAGP